MFKSIDARFNEIIEIFKSAKASTLLVEKAYSVAKELHKEQLRKDGTPYISHPVEVALILAQLGFSEDVICAGLLHDVVEDCEYALKEIAKNFNSNVAQLVDSVSAIDKEKVVFDKNDIYANEEFEKSTLEDQSFKKLLSIGKNNPEGFCIKFADRLHNLRTISIFSYSKQLEKVKETERWIIPIAKHLNAEYFYRALKNECFKIVHQNDGKMYFEQYDNYHHVNKLNIEQLTTKLNEAFANTKIKYVKIKDVREYKVYEDLTKILKLINISKVSQGQILKVANYNIYLLHNNLEFKDVVDEVFYVINSRLGSIIKFIDCKIGSFTNRPCFELEDAYKNKYNLYIMSITDYYTQRNGVLDSDNELIDAENLDYLNDDLMKIKTRSGEVVYIPKGSTVLDFAFRLHKEIGLGFKYASINKSKTKSPPYTRLMDGDQVEVFVDRDANGEIKNNCTLKWFAYINTEFAKKVLIKYFESKM